MNQNTLMFLPYIGTSLSEIFVPPERLLTLTDVAMNPKEIFAEIDIEEYNVGSLGGPK